MRCMMARSNLFGHVSLEFDHVVDRLAVDLGLE
jgi:hypothetical protein